MSEPASLANFLSRKLAVRSCTDKPGRGVFAAETVEAGELVAVWGGRIVARAEAEALPPEWRRYVVQVEEAQFLAPLEPLDAAELINHCCQPTCGLSGQIALVALRRLRPGEEITFDYATSDGSSYDEFECACGTASCRGKITGRDWLLPDLQRRYRGWFSPYLTRRIATLTVTGTDAREEGSA